MPKEQVKSNFWQKFSHNIKYTLMETLNPNGKISLPAILGCVSCIISLLGFMGLVPVTNASQLFNDGLIAVGLGTAESMTSIIKRKTGSE